MSLLPPFGAVRRRLPLIGGALVLTQLPALALLLRTGWPGGLTAALYLAASATAFAGLFAVALALWRRIARIVALVEGFVEQGHLPEDAPTAPRGSLGAVRASLSRLDRLVRTLESEAARDPLTGVYNRRAGALRLREDLVRARRSSVPLSVAVFDLDELKSINDRWGHAAGDEALRCLARTLDGATREGDWVARWGGDEFLIGLWNADRNAAVVATDRVLCRLSGERLEIADASVSLGSGVGIAELEGDDDAERLFARADAALLEEKRQKRRRGRIS